jgi:hypothetical protein
MLDEIGEMQEEEHALEVMAQTAESIELKASLVSLRGNGTYRRLIVEGTSGCGKSTFVKHYGGVMVDFSELCVLFPSMSNKRNDVVQDLMYSGAQEQEANDMLVRYDRYPVFDRAYWSNVIYRLVFDRLENMSRFERHLVESNGECVTLFWSELDDELVKLIVHLKRVAARYGDRDVYVVLIDTFLPGALRRITQRGNFDQEFLEKYGSAYVAIQNKYFKQVATAMHWPVIDLADYAEDYTCGGDVDFECVFASLTKTFLAAQRLDGYGPPAKESAEATQGPTVDQEDGGRGEADVSSESDGQEDGQGDQAQEDARDTEHAATVDFHGC